MPQSCQLTAKPGGQRGEQVLQSRSCRGTTVSAAKRGGGTARASAEYKHLKSTCQEVNLLTYKEVCNIAAQRSLHLKLRTLGPFYWIQCKDGNEHGPLLGTTNGFIVPPLKLMHCDTMQIYTRRKGGEEGDRQRGGILGLGALLATAVFAYGYWSGCRKAEILAINDNDYTHRKLVAYYRRLFGFKVVREVGGNGLRDLPDLLVWGGVGTRMNGDLESMLCKCSLTFQRPPRKARSLT